MTTRAIKNPFQLKDKVDNNLRPYTAGIREHDQSLSTIVLYTGDVPLTSKVSSTPDYLSPDSRERAGVISPKAAEDGEKPAIQTNVAQLQNDSNGMYLGVFNNFSLMGVNESKEQITKLQQNFGNSWNLFFFGDRPSIYNFSGLFLDTWEYPYYQEFMTMYDRYLSGRKCVENGYKMKVIYDGKIVGGYLMNIKTSLSSDTPHTKAFMFTVVITDEGFMRNNARITDSGSFTGGSAFNGMYNTHRVLRQYPSLFGGDDQSLETTDVNQQHTPEGYNNIAEKRFA